MKRRRRDAGRRLERRIAAIANPDPADTLEDFRFFAILGTWMEEDVVEATVRNALAQGAEAVYLVDNASTDATVARATAAGAVVAESYQTEVYEEPLRILLMNAAVARLSLASGAAHVWWLWLDADEFPEGPGGLSIAQYLATLDRRFRLVGSTYYNHFPSTKPEYLPGFHPVDFQPLCERYTSRHIHFCPQPHWKHPLQRFDRHDRYITAGGGFHTAWLRTRQPLVEPEGGIVTHHVTYRQEAFSRRRLELLCGESARNQHNDSVGNRTIERRFRSLDAVYAGDWERVNNLRGDGTMLGVHPTPWPDPSSTRRWYGEDDLAAAKEAWRLDYAPSAPA
jgi:hypothetical protein